MCDNFSHLLNMYRRSRWQWRHFKKKKKVFNNFRLSSTYKHTFFFYFFFFFFIENDSGCPTRFFYVYEIVKNLIYTAKLITHLKFKLNLSQDKFIELTFCMSWLWMNEYISNIHLQVLATTFWFDEILSHVRIYSLFNGMNRLQFPKITSHSYLSLILLRLTLLKSIIFKSLLLYFIINYFHNHQSIALMLYLELPFFFLVHFRIQMS